MTRYMRRRQGISDASTTTSTTSMRTRSGRSAAVSNVTPSPRSTPSMTFADHVESLRTQLTRSATEAVESAIAVACNEFSREMDLKQKQVLTGPPSVALMGISGALDPQEMSYDMYHKCCRRLVRYIDQNMVTSPGFVQQMERIILACHSEASANVLSSVVNERLWFHCIGNEASTAMNNETIDIKTDEGEASQEEVDEKENVATRNNLRSSTRVKREVSEAVALYERRGRTRSSKRLSGGDEEPPAKRTRRETRSRRYVPEVQEIEDSEEDEPMHDDEQPEEEQGEEDEAAVVDGDAADHDDYEEALASGVEHRNTRESMEEDEGYVEEVKPRGRRGRKGRPSRSAPAPSPPEGGDELLTFKDAIGELCYPENRAPSQTRFFKERLRKSIVHVDAQLCKPPPGKVCGRDCRKIRAQMCNRDQPCKNKLCRIWHDVEAHTDRCQNTKCEFRNRIMLRETMHKIDRKKLDIQHDRAEVRKKQRELDEIRKKAGEDNDRDAFIESTLLENEVTQLEKDISSNEEELAALDVTKKAFVDVLTAIGITEEDDEKDHFPDYYTHYVEKKQAGRKARSGHGSQEVETLMTPNSSPSKPEKRRPGRRGSGPHGFTVIPAAGMPYSFRRSTRRGNQAWAEVIEIDDEDDDDDEELEPESILPNLVVNIGRKNESAVVDHPASPSDSTKEDAGATEEVTTQSSGANDVDPIADAEGNDKETNPEAEDDTNEEASAPAEVASSAKADASEHERNAKEPRAVEQLMDKSEETKKASPLAQENKPAAKEEEKEEEERDQEVSTTADKSPIASAERVAPSNASIAAVLASPGASAQDEGDNEGHSAKIGETEDSLQKTES